MICQEKAGMFQVNRQILVSLNSLLK